MIPGNNAGPDATNAEAQELNSFTNQTTTEPARPSSGKKPKKPKRERGSGKTGRVNRKPEEIAALRQSLIDLVLNYGRPTTIRHLYYLAVTAGLGPKSDSFYQDVIKRMGEARRSGELDFAWILDNTRTISEPLTFRNIPHALEWLIAQYELSYWDQPETECQVYVGCEADTVAHIIEEITFHKYAVPFCCARGASSITYIHEDIAKRIEADGRPAYLYYFGDFDKNGMEIFESLRDDLKEWAPNTNVTIRRIGVTQEQIEEYGLLTHDCKNDQLAKWYAKTGQTEVCELDAMEADDLKALVEAVIVQHIDMAAFEAMKEREAEDKKSLRDFATKFGGVS